MKTAAVHTCKQTNTKLLNVDFDYSCLKHSEQRQWQKLKAEVAQQVQRNNPKAAYQNPPKGFRDQAFLYSIL